MVVNADAATQADVPLTPGACLSVVDTVVLTTGMVVLVRQQALPAENWVYLVTDAGTGANDGTWARLPELATGASMATLALVKVRDSAGVSALVEYIPTSIPPYVVGVTPVQFAVYPSAVAPPAGAPLYWGNSGLTTTVTTRFLDPGYVPANARVVRTSYEIPQDGILDRLFTHHNVVGVGGNITYTVEVNGVPSVLSVTLLASALTGSNLIPTVPVIAGDNVTIRVTKPAAITTSPQRVLTSLRFRPL